MTNEEKDNLTYSYEEVMCHATDDDRAAMKAGILDQVRMKSIAQRILRGRECEALSVARSAIDEDPEITIIKDELDAREVLPHELKRRDPSLPWELIDSGHLVFNADGKTTSLPDDPQLDTLLDDRAPYSPTEADKSWCKRNHNDELPTCFGHAKVRLQMEALKNKKGYRGAISKHYDHLFG